LLTPKRRDVSQKTPLAKRKTRTAELLCTGEGKKNKEYRTTAKKRRKKITGKVEEKARPWEKKTVVSGALSRSEKTKLEKTWSK